MKFAHKQLGMSYLEVLIAIIILTIALPAALQTLTQAVNHSRLYAHSVDAVGKLKSTMETVLNESYGDLDAAGIAAGSPTTLTTYSDSVGTDHRALVYLWRYDGDNADADNDPFTGVDAELLWIKVEIENSPHSFETLLTP